MKSSALFRLPGLLAARHQGPWICAWMFALQLGWVTLPLGLPSSALAQAAAPAEQLRPALGKLLQGAQELLAAGKAEQAMAALREADKITDRTAFETFVHERLRVAAALSLKDEAGALRAYAAALSTGRFTAEERRAALAAMAGLALRVQDGDAAIRWAQEHLAAGGTDDDVRAVIVRAALAKGDCALVVAQGLAMIESAEKRQQTPAEGLLKAVPACQAKLGNEAGYVASLERLLQHHPKPEYWADLIARLQRKPGFADRLLLDTFRLMRHVDAMEDAEDFLGGATLAVKAALPGEAQAFLRRGFETGALGKGPSAQAHRDQQARVEREVVGDRSQLDEAERAALAGKDGRRLFLVGQAAWSYGQHERALRLMEQALTRGVERQVQDAQLHYAIALISAGRKADARKVLTGVNGSDGLSDLARLWLLALR